MTPTANRTSPPLLLEKWRAWEGAIDCTQSSRVWSAGELRAWSGSAAAAFDRMGMRAGHRVAFAMANTAAFPVGLMALLECGCNPLLVYAGTAANDLARTARQLNVQWFVHDFDEAISRLTHADYPGLREIEIAGRKVGVTPWPDAAVPVETDVHGVILHPTSGTYGASKYCYRNQAVAVAEGENYVASIDAYDHVRIRVTTPLSHAFAYGFGMAAALVTHSTLVLDTAFNPKRVLAREAAAPSGIMAVVPPMLRSLAQLSRRGDPMAGLVFYAGAPCDETTKTGFERACAATVHAIYGTTETGAISTTYGRQRRFAGVGVPLRNVRVRIANAKAYGSLSPDTGEIQVASTSMMQGYAGAEECNFEFWSTADIGRLDAEGAIHITGRTKDIINLGGMKVDPAEVESVLRSHPAVVDVAVYPGLHPHGSEFVQAAIHAPAGFEPEELRQLCLAELDGYKVPSLFHHVDMIPRTPSGKCLKIKCPGFPPDYIVG